MVKHDVLYITSFDLSVEKRALIRKSYSNDELVELVKLLQRRRLELTIAENKIAEFVNQNKRWVDYFASKSNRYQVLLDLVNNPVSEDPSSFKLADVLEKTLDKNTFSFPQKELKFYPYALLHPFTLVAVVPDKGKNLSPLDPVMENPFMTSYREYFFMNQGDEKQMASVIANYKMLREMDNPEPPKPVKVSEDAVGLAFMDTGVDFKTLSDLGVFLGDGSNGHLQSYDYTDP